MPSQTLRLPAGQTLTVTADAASYGTVHRLPVNAGDEPFSPVAIAAGDSLVLGPFATERGYSINTTSGALTYAVTVEDFPAETQIDELEALSANLATIPADRDLILDANAQSAIFGTFTVDGSLRIDGELRVSPWPA